MSNLVTLYRSQWRPEVRTDKVKGVQRSRRAVEWELTEQRWCLFSLWLVMGGCSQHKHMPSWLTHFLPHSTSLRWATQAQDTTAGPLYSLPLHAYVHAICMLTALVVVTESECMLSWQVTNICESYTSVRATLKDVLAWHKRGYSALYQCTDQMTPSWDNLILT